MPASSPARDLSEAPDDWLQAYYTWINEDDSGDDRFALHMQAIYRMRDIAEREGRSWHAPFEEVKAELIRRGLREPDPDPEFMSRSATVAVIKEKTGYKLHQARYLANLLPHYAEDGGKWLYNGKWYRIADVRELLAD